MRSVCEVSESVMTIAEIQSDMLSFEIDMSRETTYSLDMFMAIDKLPGVEVMPEVALNLGNLIMSADQVLLARIDTDQLTSYDRAHQDRIANLMKWFVVELSPNHSLIWGSVPDDSTNRHIGVWVGNSKL